MAAAGPPRGAPRRPAANGRRLLGGANGVNALLAAVKAHNDTTPAELADAPAAQTGRRWGTSAVYRALQRLDWPRKKDDPRGRAGPRRRGRGTRRLARGGQIDPARLIFVDESGIDTRMTRRFARAPRGQRACGTVPWARWQRLTLLGALGREGLVAMMSVAAATSIAVFRAVVEQVLAPAVRERGFGTIVAFDNLAAHRAATVHDTLRTPTDQVRGLKAHGCAVRFLPRYAPELNPIEHCWSKIETFLRSKRVRSLAELERELAAAIETVTPEDTRGWFRYCSYALN